MLKDNEKYLKYKEKYFKLKALKKLRGGGEGDQQGEQPEETAHETEKCGVVIFGATGMLGRAIRKSFETKLSHWNLLLSASKLTNFELNDTERQKIPQNDELTIIDKDPVTHKDKVKIMKQFDLSKIIDNPNEVLQEINNNHNLDKVALSSARERFNLSESAKSNLFDEKSGFIGEEKLKKNHVKLVIYTAAMRDPATVHSNSIKALLINVIAPYLISEHINKLNKNSEIKIKFLYISTDYVFEGLKPISYKDGIFKVENNEDGIKEDKDTCPISTYSKQKVLAERSLQSIGSNNLILRVPVLYSPDSKKISESSVMKVLHQVIDHLGSKQNDILTEDGVQIRYPTLTTSIATAIHLLAKNLNYEKDDQVKIYHFQNKNGFTKFQMAELFKNIINKLVDDLDLNNDHKINALIKAKEIDIKKKLVGNLDSLERAGVGYGSISYYPTFDELKLPLNSKLDCNSLLAITGESQEINIDFKIKMEELIRDYIKGDMSFFEESKLKKKSKDILLILHQHLNKQSHHHDSRKHLVAPHAPESPHAPEPHASAHAPESPHARALGFTNKYIFHRKI